jgi:hypothetical protein
MITDIASESNCPNIRGARTIAIFFRVTELIVVIILLLDEMENVFMPTF